VTRERFPRADELHAAWPGDVLDAARLHEGCHVAVLAHDLKIEIPALQRALRSRARYVGALGSRKTHAKRVEKLLEAGLSSEEIARIHAPIGLDLGAERPAEIALAILAQMLATR
jgi:xanthine dehydrogenase accessory factor